LPKFNKAQRTGGVPQLIFANTLYLGLIAASLVILDCNNTGVTGYKK
jgi:hypothetical protein